MDIRQENNKAYEDETERIKKNVRGKEIGVNNRQRRSNT